MVYVLLVLPLLAAATVGAYLFVRARRPSAEGPRLHVNCPSCKRRLGYHARQAGRQVVCPRCHRPFTFPGAFAAGRA